MSGAHATLPLPSYVRVTNISNHKSVIVRLNDRGPYSGNRLIDVSEHAASLLGFHGGGLAPVRVEYVGRAPLEGSDDIMLMATLRENGDPAPSPSLVRVASMKGFMPASLSSAPVVPASHAKLRDVPTPPERPYGLGDGQQVSNFRATGQHRGSAGAHGRAGPAPCAGTLGLCTGASRPSRRRRAVFDDSRPLLNQNRSWLDRSVERVYPVFGPALR